MIRQEQAADYPAVEAVIQAAFVNEEISDKQEHHVVKKLRNSQAFIPELSLVAERNGRIIGHILLTKIHIGEAISLALAPVSVLPDFQQQGIGTRLIQEALQKAQKLGYHSVIVLGHPAYYPKFGFMPASQWHIIAPFDVPQEAFMALELCENGLQDVTGVVKYDEAFLDE
ncbi:GNAT family N-acetyltransferase [Lysinibacillus piscis]|uniref:N-acetyltransferase n=1 Tax=Lysinibacillus piscis TaxID=2518931 RepID=A0ABQ5NJI9_9BACI|nr:N-acetyltransferase [Lysinibacillus sp. KH24]GLC88531.1 N-acetyltransferase [Lysinibacillus sp. KH24]